MCIRDRYNEAKFSPNFNIGMRLEALPEDKRPAACVGCGQCARVCPQNIDIPAALADLNEVLKNCLLYTSAVGRWPMV